MRRAADGEQAVSVLIVDDNEEIAELYASVLASAGYAVTTAADGRAGLGLAAVLQPDLIILDMMMPELSGLEFLSRLQEEPSSPPVIANSGYPAFGAFSLARGATAFLVKPVEPPDLLATVERTLDGRPAAAISAPPQPQPA